jgi:AraC-like DNA-binding protein
MNTEKRRAQIGHAIDRPLLRALRPSGALTAFVDHYWFSVQATAPVATLLPDGRVDVVLAQTESRATLSVFGSVTACTDIVLVPGTTYIGVQFRPGQARHFVHGPARELTDQAMPGPDVLAFDLEQALDAGGPLAAITALDAALVRQLTRVQPSITRVDHLVACLEAAHGNVRVRDLADRFRISPRQIERAFLDAVGLSPKAFASILRFRHAAAQLRAGLAVAEAALAAGYADQSHLHQAFRRYAGLTPVHYARCDVAFFQDSKYVGDQDDGFSMREALST